MSSGYKLYNYDPSTGAAILFAAIFGATTAFHIWQMFNRRTWYFIPFIIGGMFEAFGYTSRYYSAKQTPNWTTMPYVGQSLLLLLAPSLFSASIYMILGRIIRLLQGSSRSLIRPSWLTKIFVTGDVLSFFIQSGGGGMMASAKTESSVKLGNNIIIGGLFVQIIFFGFFIVVSVIFHRRMSASPTQVSMNMDQDWRRYMGVLYTVSVLIMVRSIYRVIEYVQGTTGYFQSHEAFLYIFDAVLMFICCVIFNVFHPSRILSDKKAYGKMQEDLEMLTG